MNNDNTILEVKELSVSFDGRTVVDKICYTLQRGRTLGIVGESGSGKSVSSMALMGLLPKNAIVSGSAILRTENASGERSGNVELLSLDEDGFREIRGKRISMIFQEPMTSLNPVQKCGEQVVEMLKTKTKTKTEDRERVIELFREVLLPRPEKIFESYPHEISGGQKQRVMIAMALINNPDIIIADEPTTALDVTVQKTILDLLRQLQKKHGMAIIFITHDLGVIAQIADDIAVMYHGEIVEMGPTETIIHHPQHPYTRGLLACRPPLYGRPRRLPTVEEFLRNEKQNENEDQNENENDNQNENDNENDNENENENQNENEDQNENPNGGLKEPLLSVKNLNVTYTLEKSFFGKPRKQMKAVDGMTFDVYKGETLGLVGESGCGKTTLGRALLRLIDSQSDSVMFDGVRLDTLSPCAMRKLRQKIQIIFQDPYSSLNPRLTVGQAIMEPLMV